MNLFKIFMSGFLLLTSTTLTAHGKDVQPLTSTHTFEESGKGSTNEIPINSEIKPKSGCNPLDPRCD